MRKLFIGFVVAVSTTLVPMIATAGNQEVAERIAKSLHESGQLKDYKIGVRYDNGTAWLEGSVASEQQMNTALKLVFLSEEVNRVVNRLEMTPVTSSSPASPQPIQTALAPEITRPMLASHVATKAEESGSLERLERTIAQRSPTKRVPLATETPQVAQRQMMQRVQGVPGRPIPVAYMQGGPTAGMPGRPLPTYTAATGGGAATPARYDQPCMPNYAWPSYASHPNYAALTYPKQYSPTAWPYIGPFYPYPQVPLGWRKVSLEWDDGWWMLDFYDHHKCH